MTRDERDRAITAAVLRSPLTLRAIGEQHGLSAGRVRVVAQQVRYTRWMQKQMAREERLPLHERRVEFLPFSTRLKNGLRNGAIVTVADLLRQSDTELLKIKNFGRGCLRELCEWFDANGVSNLKDPPGTPVQFMTAPCSSCGGSGLVRRRIKP